MNCKQCGTETGSDRKQTCSTKCRVAFSRSVTKSPESVTLSPETVTDVTLTTGTVTGDVTDLAGKALLELGANIDIEKQFDTAADYTSPGVATLIDYYARPVQYATLAHPDLLNWGQWMNSAELTKAGFKANRVSIPGDWDYKKVG